jgi:hypothetical protein
MTLDATLLERLVNWHPPRDSRQTLAVADEGAGWTASITADRHDDLGSAIWEMTLRRRRALTRSTDDLKNWAHRAAVRVTGLLEPLQVVEVDTLRDEALLRSSQPRKRGMGLYYYEALFKGVNEVYVRRYQGRREGGRREQVAFTLTHETLAQFAADLIAD